MKQEAIDIVRFKLKQEPVVLQLIKCFPEGKEWKIDNVEIRVTTFVI